MKKLLAFLGLLTVGAYVTAGPGWATSFSVANNQTVTSAQTLNASETGTVNLGGTLTVNTTSDAVLVSGNATIVNNGNITQTNLTTSGSTRAIRSNTAGVVLTVTNNVGATIQAADSDAIQMNKGSGNITLFNYGTITTVNGLDGGQALDFNAVTTGNNTVYNYATGVIKDTQNDAIRPGVNGFVYNDGLILSTTNNANTIDGINTQTNSGATIVNATTGSGVGAGNTTGTGLIEGGHHGIGGGIKSGNASFAMSITNNLGGTIQGDNGAGVNIDGFNATEVVTIVNAGTITGNGTTTDGDGVDVDGVVNLTNSGTIKSIQAFNDTSEGVTVGGGNITNTGTIEGDNTPANGGVGRGITLAGVDKDTAGNPIPTQGIYENTTVTNSGLIKGSSDSGIALTGAATNFTVTITNLAGGTIEGGGATAAAVQLGGDKNTLVNSGTIIADSSNKAIDLGVGGTLQILGGAASITGNISGGTGNTSTLAITPGTGNTFNYSGTISNFQSVSVGNGTVTLSGPNTYTGNTSVTGGTLIVGVANALQSTSNITVTGGTLVLTGAGGINRVNDAAGMTLSGGTLKFANGLSGASETMGTLTLTANSTIDFGNGHANTLLFSSLVLNGHVLTILDWTGSAYGSMSNDPGPLTGDSTQDRLLFTADPGLPTSSAGTPLLQFYDDGGNFISIGKETTYQTNQGSELVPVPEPTTVCVALGLLGLAVYRERRRLVGLLPRG